MTKAYLVSEELLRQVLDTMERSVTTCFDEYAHRIVMKDPSNFMNVTMETLRTLLAKEPSEPVAWWTGQQGNASCFKTTTMPVAYLMENDESKWLGWEPDECADFVTPLYKEKWKVAK